MNRGKTVFAQLLDFIPFNHFEHLCDRFAANHGIKHFSAWNQFICMAYAQLTRRDGLRDLVACLNSQKSKLYHIGIQQCPKSTLADANERRDYRIYEEFAKSLMQRTRRQYAQTQLALDVDNAVYALDASTVDLTLSLYPWAKFRATKGAIKLHTMIDLRGNIPAFLSITDGKVHDVKAAPLIPMTANTGWII